MSEIYTLYTRSNFDGLVCAALLKEIGMIDEIKFVHPKDVQDGKIQLPENTITASLPYCNGVYIAFDHHSSESKRIKDVKDNYIIEPAAPSSARVIYEYFGGADRFSASLHDLMDAVDKADCTNFTEEDIVNPKDWVLLNYLMDARTGLGRFRNFRISNLELMYKLVDLFLEKSMQILKLDGKLCFLLPSGPLLYNSHSLEFRTQFFTNYNVTQIIDLVYFRRILFEATVTTLALFVENAKPKDEAPIKHIVPKRTKVSKDKIFFEIDHYDFHAVPRSKVLADLSVWKSNILGGYLVYNIANKIANSFNIKIKDIPDLKIFGSISSKLKNEYVTQ